MFISFRKLEKKKCAHFSRAIFLSSEQNELKCWNTLENFLFWLFVHSRTCTQMNELKYEMRKIKLNEFSQSICTSCSSPKDGSLMEFPFLRNTASQFITWKCLIKFRNSFVCHLFTLCVRVFVSCKLCVISTGLCFPMRMWNGEKQWMLTEMKNKIAARCE